MGRPVERSEFEYEICFKCHAEQVARPSLTTIARQINQTNTRLEFQVANPSFHPVIGPRNNRDVVSLKAPWRVAAMVRCTDCHNSDASSARLGGGQAGPHGSIYAPLLIDNYTTHDNTSEVSPGPTPCAIVAMTGPASWATGASRTTTGTSPAVAYRARHAMTPTASAVPRVTARTTVI